MRLLFIVPYAPTPIRTRPHNFLRTLARRGHEIHLATLWKDPGEQAALSEIEAWGIRVLAFPQRRVEILQNVLGAVVSGDPVQARYSRSIPLESALQDSLTGAPFDAVHIEHMRGAAYGELIAGRAPIVWDSVDSISHLFSQAAEKSLSRFGQLASRFELGRTRDYEGRMIHRFDHVLVTSEQDRKALLELAAREPGLEAPRISVIPNGVDTETFFPIDSAVQNDTIIFTGKMSYHANVTAVVQFVRDVMPAIWRSRPEVRLLVVGKDPGRQVRQLGEAGRVQVVGAVDEMRPYLSRAAVSVAPIAYGAGIQNKVLEAMACRTAVVASPQAVSALQVRRDVDVLVADRPEDFSASVLHLLDDPEVRASIAEAGYEYVLKNHRWEAVVSRLEEIYLEAVHSIR